MNKIRLFLLLFAIMLSFCVNAQSFEWATAYGGQNLSEATDIQRDTLGNLYIIGTFKDTLQMGATTLSGDGSNDIFFAKLDSSGNVLWAEKVGGIGSDEGFSIGIDANLNIYVAGSFQTAITVGTTTFTAVGTSSSFFFAKYTNAGSFIWASDIYTPNVTLSNLPFNGFDMAIAPNGIVYLAGVFQGTLQLPTSNANLSSPGGNATTTSYLIKFNTNGVYQNGINVSAATRTYVNSVIVDNQGNPIVGGYAYSFSCLGCTINGIQDLLVFVRRYNSSSLVLNKSVASSTAPAPDGFSNLGVEVAVDENNDIYLAGEFLGNLTFSSILLNNSNAISTTDIFIAKVQTTNSAWEWATTIGGTGNENILALSVRNGGLYLAGDYEISLISGNTTIQTPTSEGFIAKYTDLGNAEYLRKIEGGFGSRVNGIVADDNESVYLTGQFIGQAIFDLDTLISVSNTDVFVSKISCLPLPVRELNGDSITCLGQKNYTIPIAPGVGTTYNWSLSGGGILVANGDVATVNWTTKGLHTISITSNNICGSSNAFTYQVRVLDVPELPQISGDTTPCLGSETYSVINVFGENYTWTVSGGGTIFPLGNTAIINWSVVGGHKIFVSPSNICGIGNTAVRPVVVDKIPVQPSPIQGVTNTCVSTKNYSVSAVFGVTYNWSLSSGGTLTENGNTATINWTTAGTHTLIVTPSNDCGVGSSRQITVTVNDVPQQPSSFVGNTTVCIGTETYSVVGQANTNYTWSISGGGALSFLGNTATVNWTTAGTHTLTVSPSNICGSGTPRTVAITVINVPSQPASIIGIDTVCIGTQNYLITPQNGVNYAWTLSGGGSILPNGNQVTVNWTTAGTHTLTILPSNACGSGQAKSKIIVVTSTNSGITGVTGDNDVCLGIENYSVPNINGFNYTWSLSSGGNLTTLNNAVFVNWTSTGFHTLAVTTSDGCSNAITVEVEGLPNQPQVIQGNSVVCLGQNSYFVPAENGVNYTWTLSGGGILTQANNAANITWTTPGTYQLAVIPSNDCGNGTPRNLTIDVLTIPQTPTAIQGDATVCLGNYNYSVAASANVSYVWNLANSGAAITTNNHQATVNFQNIGINTLTVSATNICGSSPTQSLPITILGTPTQPQITGDLSVCLGSENYVININNNENYNWSIGSGGSLTVQNDTAFVNWTTAGTHNINVSATNICGISPLATQAVQVRTIPQTLTQIVGDTVVCQGIKTYSVTNENGTNFNWQLSGGGSIVALGNTSTINWTTAGTYTLTVTPSNNCGIGATITKTVTVIVTPTQPSSIIGNISVCNNSETYSIINQQNVTYNWTVNGGGTITGNGNNATVNWNTPGTYTISVIANTQCGASLPRTLTVTVNDVPTQPQITLGDTLVCLGSELYTVNLQSGVSYNWQLSSGGTINTANNNATINWTTAGNHIITVTPSSGCGNGQAKLINVVVKTTPNAIAQISGNGAVCLGTQTYSINPVLDENYNWSLSSGGNLSVLGSSVQINWLTEGTHTLSVTPTNLCGIGATTALSVQVQTVPQMTTTISGETLACANTIETYDVITAASGVNYAWNLASGGSISQNNNAATVNWQTTGTHLLTVTPNNQCGTGNPQTISVTIDDIPSLTGDISGDTAVCLNSEAFYAIQNQQNITYNWRLSQNGNLATLGNSAIINWSAVGESVLSVFPSNQCGNGDTLTKNIKIVSALTTPQITFTRDTLFSSNDVGNQWFYNGEAIENATDNFFKPFNNGIYTVISKNICGSTNTSQPYSFGIESGLFLYPNPGREQITLRIPPYLTWYSVDAIDMLGREVLQMIPSNGSNEILIDVSQLEAGIYWFRIDTELLLFYRKVVIVD
jgi:hypothetical protein